MEVCDPALAAHAARVATNAEAVAVRLGWTDDELEALRLGAALHDVGKVNVRHDVLTKPGRLEDWELAEIRTHPVEGLWLLSGVTSLAPALPFVLFHHERWDGHGYPTRRAGESIPIQGRILAVADAFDAMTSLRPVPAVALAGRGGSGDPPLCRYPVRSDRRRRVPRRIRGRRDRVRPRGRRGLASS